MTAAKDLLKSGLALPVAERAALVEAINESLERREPPSWMLDGPATLTSVLP